MVAIDFIDAAMTEVLALGPEAQDAIIGELQAASTRLKEARALVERTPAEAAYQVELAREHLDEAALLLGTMAQERIEFGQRAVADAQGSASEAEQNLTATASELVRDAEEAAAMAQDTLARSASQLTRSACPPAKEAMAALAFSVWTSCNMGQGSGLDADTLDGVDSALFSRVGHRHDELYLGKAERAADSALLEGLPAAAFAPTEHGHDDQYYTKAASDGRFLRSDSDTSIKGSLAVSGRAGIGVPPTKDIVLHLRNTIPSDNGVLTLEAGNGKRWNLNSVVGGSFAVQDSSGPGFPAQAITRLLIDSAGNLGVGTTPEFRLDVAGDANADRLCIDRDCRDSWPSQPSVSPNDHLRVAILNASGGPQAEDFPIRIEAPTTALYLSAADVDNLNGGRISYGFGATENGRDPRGFIIRDNNANAPRFFIDDQGNVGVGTTTPNARLEVTGGASEILRVSGTNSGNLFLRNTGLAAREYRITSHENYYGGGLFIQDQTAPGFPVRLVIDGPSGNIGIGTTAPLARLDVAGSLRVGGGSVIGGIQRGVVGDYVGKTGTTVNFPQVFASPPTVLLTVDESDDNNGATGCRLNRVTTTDFQFWCFAGTADANAYRVHWMALG